MNLKVEERNEIKAINGWRNAENRKSLAISDTLCASADYRCQAMDFDRRVSNRGHRKIHNYLKRQGAVEIEEVVTMGDTINDARLKAGASDVYIKDYDNIGIAIRKNSRGKYFLCIILTKDGE